MAFFEYDMVLTPKGEERHILRIDGQRLPAGRFCRITRAKNGHGWDRLTQWDSKHGRRTYWFESLDEAMTSGIRWAKKRFSDG